MSNGTRISLDVSKAETIEIRTEFQHTCRLCIFTLYTFLLLQHSLRQRTKLFIRLEISNLYSVFNKPHVFDKDQLNHLKNMKYFIYSEHFQGFVNVQFLNLNNQKNFYSRNCLNVRKQNKRGGYFELSFKYSISGNIC